MSHQPSLLDQAVLGMVHREDPSTSVAAAAAIAPRQTELHAKVLDAFATRGPMTDAELEELPMFRGYGPSTIRKRRSELYQAGRLVTCGERSNARGRKMLIWRIAS